MTDLPDRASNGADAVQLRRRLKLKIALLAGLGLAGWLLAFGFHPHQPPHPAAPAQAHSRTRSSWIEVFDFLPVLPPRPPCSAYRNPPPPSA